jgi:hypothetical protein
LIAAQQQIRYAGEHLIEALTLITTEFR